MQSFQVILCAEFKSARAAPGRCCYGGRRSRFQLSATVRSFSKASCLGEEKPEPVQGMRNVVSEGKRPLLGTSLSHNRILSPQYTYIHSFLLVCEYATFCINTVLKKSLGSPEKKMVTSVGYMMTLYSFFTADCSSSPCGV